MIKSLSFQFSFKILKKILGKAIGLPDDFLALKAGSKGGGVIQVNKFTKKKMIFNA